MAASETINLENEEEEDIEVIASTSGSSRIKKISPIWDYFIEFDDGSKAKCKVCSKLISRSGSGKSATNTTMKNHLKIHKKEYERYETAVTPKKIDQRQLTLEQTLQATKQWEIHDNKAVEIHTAIGEMIAVDNCPISCVENTGFRRVLKKLQPRYAVPGRTFFTNRILPDIHTKCLAAIQKRVSVPQFLSFTTDIWTAPHNNESFISLTAHWISEDFFYQHAVLNTSNFPGSHTGKAIAEKLKNMTEQWKISKERIHLVLRDNAANMVKGIADAGFPAAGCFLHTLQLAIEDSIRSQRAVSDMIAASRKIVTHFNHSAVSTAKLHAIQKEFNFPKHKLLQDVSTRWNSTYYMLNRIQQQKSAITHFAANKTGITNLTQNQWNLIQGTLSLLQPFEEITKIISETESVISEVIPCVMTLTRYLGKHDEMHSGVGIMKDTLKKSVEKRFQSLLQKYKYTAASFLDPRFKLIFIPNENKDNLKSQILEEVVELSSREVNPVLNGLAVEESTEPQTIPNTHTSFWACFSEITTSSNQNFNVITTEEASSAQIRIVINSEIVTYASISNLDRKENPFKWWRDNHSSYPHLSKLVRKYLSAPASSVFSERLFSEEGIIYEDKRSRLLPERGEMLTFLNRNLQLLNFRY